MEESHLQHLFLKYSQMLYKISVLMLCNEQDANDAVQDTFIRYLSADRCFGDEEHEKAWLIRVNINICKNMLRFRRMHPTTTYEDLTSCPHSAEDIGLMNALLELKEKDQGTAYLILHRGIFLQRNFRIFGDFRRSCEEKAGKSAEKVEG